MCMIIDANTIPCVFSKNNAKHEAFKPVLEWIVYGKGKISLGGKLLTKEIVEKQRSYIQIILELNKFNKIHKFDNSIVDKKEEEIKQKERDPDFDDPHIIALSIVSGAKIICSDDQRSFKFIGKIKEYEKSSEVPKIYTTMGHNPHTELLCDLNICGNGNHSSLNKDLADKLWKAIENKK